MHDERNARNPNWADIFWGSVGAKGGDDAVDNEIINVRCC